MVQQLANLNAGEVAVRQLHAPIHRNLVSLAASLSPTVRAASMDPVVALRYE